MEIDIGGRKVGDGHACYVIADLVDSFREARELIASV